jgi:chemotaxis signal transduction protein
MVLRDEGLTVGLAVDAVRGLVRLPQESIRQVHHDDAEGEFFHSVGVLDDGSLISLLDPARLMRQTRAWASNAGAEPEAAGRAGPAPVASALSASTPPQVLVRVGQATLGIEAALVVQVRASGALQPLDLGQSALAGMMQLHALHVPVLDPGKALGIARPGADAAALVMVLAHQGRYAALPVDSVLSVRPFAEAEVQQPDTAGLAPGGCFAGVARLADGQPVLLVDGRALIERHGMNSLADPSAGTAGGAGTTGKLDPQAYVVVDAGATWALPMRCLEEITVFPADFHSLPGASDHAAGSCSWRGHALPVLDVRDGGARGLDPDGQRLLVVRHGGQLAGLWVNDVIALLPAHSVEQTRFSLAGSAPVTMLTTSQAQGRHSYRVLDPGGLPFFSEACGEGGTLPVRASTIMQT